MFRAHAPQDNQRDHGSATVLVLACILAGSVLALLWFTVARGALVRQRAETAADLSALAAAAAAAAPARAGPAPCAIAATIASHNGAQLESCALADGRADVSVSVNGPPVARAEARAGPVNDPPALG